MDQDKLNNLENEVFQLRYELSVIKGFLFLKNTPEWASSLKLKAESAGLRPSPYGEGYDTYRLLELLDKLGILPEKRD